MAETRDPPYTGADPAATARRAVGRAIADARRGEAMLLVDGAAAALALPAENATPARISAMARLGGGEPHLAITARRAAVLHIRPTGEDVVLLAVGRGVAPEEVADLADPSADLAHPLRGPFPLAEAMPGRIDRGAITLCKLARLLPAAVVVPWRAAGGDPLEWARENDLIALPLAALEDYDADAAASLSEVASARVPLEGAEDARIFAFRPGDGGIEHLAIVIGDPPHAAPVLARLHSECFTGDLLASLKCDCGQQLRGAITTMAKAGGGVLLYLAQEGRGIGLVNKLKAYQLQDQGYDTVEANLRLGFEADERLFQPAAEMLRRLGFERVRLLTNNPDKVAALERHGIEVTERVPHAFPATGHNERYLATKARRSGHLL